MRWLRRWMIRLVGTFSREARERELAEELQSHVEFHIQDNVRAGMSPAEARRLAIIALGGLEQTRERVREGRSLRWLEHLLQDVRYAVRVLRNRPGFTAAALFSLTLGVGANTAVFGVLHALFLDTLPVARPGELVRLVEHRSDGPGDLDAFRYPMYDALRRESRSLSGVAAMSYEFGRPYEITEEGRTRTALIQLVSDNYFDVLGVRAAQGRVFQEPAGDSRAEPITVISDAYWRRQYGADPAAIGARFRWGSLEFTVAGIAPPGFVGTDLDVPVDVWVPLEQAVAPTNPSRTQGRWIRVMGRLQAGATAAAAAAEAAAVLGAPVNFQPGAVGYSTLRQRLATPLLLVQTVTALVLLIACVNLANLALAGSASRERELALRQAIGASRRRVVAQLFTEAVVLAAAGGALALLAASWINGALLAFLPPQYAPAVPNLRFEVNAAVLGFAFCSVVLVACGFGLLPALRVTRATGSVLKTGHGTTREQSTWVSRLLLTFEVAVCTVLLIVAGVFLQTVRNLKGQEAGYREEGLLLAEVYPPRQWPEERRDQLIEMMRTRAASLPGVESVGYSQIGQLSGRAIAYPVGFPGQPFNEGEAPVVFEQRISPGFLKAMGTPLMAGRDFTDADHASAQPVALVNEAFVRRLLADGDAVGRQVFAHRGSRSGEPMEIVGVVSDSRWLNLRDAPPPMYYRPYRQQGGSPVVRLALRTSGDLNTLAAALVQTAHSIHPEMTLQDVVPFREVVNRTLVIERLIAHVSGALAAVAVLVVCVGLFGVLAYAVAGRTREIGVRIALGATRGNVRWLIVRQSLLTVAFGLPAGLLSAMHGMRAAAPMLYGVTPTDSGTLAAAVGLLVAVSVAAAYVPAHRATRVDPMIALRAE